MKICSTVILLDLGGPVKYDSQQFACNFMPVVCHQLRFLRAPTSLLFLFHVPWAHSDIFQSFVLLTNFLLFQVQMLRQCFYCCTYLALFVNFFSWFW